MILSKPLSPNDFFYRSIVLVCECGESGSLGLVLNKSLDHDLGDLLQVGSGERFLLFNGGPVQEDSLLFLCRRADTISESMKIGEGICLGGSLDQVIGLVEEKRLLKGDVRFFMGYSGWAEGQLETELEDDMWIIFRDLSEELIFEVTPSKLWSIVTKKLGQSYRQLSLYPPAPEYN